MAATTSLFSALGFLQIPVALADPEKNLRQVQIALEKLAPAAGALIVMPEMWSTGFAYDNFIELASLSGELLQELTVLARRYDCLLAGSLPEITASGGESRLYNTLHIVGAAGVYGSYRKQRVFIFGGEGRIFIAGDEPRPVSTPQGLVGCLVCYDLRFPDLARSQCQQGADLLICSAQWPLLRIEQWRTLLQARAIENQTFVVACNGCGSIDGIELGGHSAVIGPEGEILFEAPAEAQASVSIPPSWPSREAFRARFASVAAAPYAFADAGKVFPSAQECLEMVARRRSIGQRVVFYTADQAQLTAQDFSCLQVARREGDYLLVGVEPVAAQKCLHTLAALGCVDALCLLAAFSEAELVRLKELVG